MIQKQIESALLALGHSPAPCRSSRYHAFYSSKPGKFFFVGKCGALRFGTSPTNSSSLTHKIPLLLKKAYGDIVL